MSKPERKELIVEDAEIIFLNFSGKEAKYNAEGEKNFCLVLDPDTAATMEADGWNIGYLEARDEGDADTPILRVAVRYDIRPPRIVMLTETSRTSLDEGSCEVLDWADIKTVDLKVNGNPWEMNGKSGLKAYLQSLYVTIEEDALEKKYAIHDNPPAELED